MSKFEFAIQASDARNQVLLEKYSGGLSSLYDKMDREIFIAAHDGQSTYQITDRDFREYDLQNHTLRRMVIDRFVAMGYSVNHDWEFMKIIW